MTFAILYILAARWPGLLSIEASIVAFQQQGPMELWRMPGTAFVSVGHEKSCGSLGLRCCIKRARTRPRTILVAAKMLGDELPKLLSPEVSER